MREVDIIHRFGLALLLFLPLVACGNGDGEKKKEGELGGPCFPNHTCNLEFVCYKKECVDPATIDVLPTVDAGDVSGACEVCGDSEEPDPLEVAEEVLDVVTNTPPTFEELSVVDLDMGASTTLDLNPFIADAEDADELLVLNWSADHVALQDDGSHVLLVVAPTDWHGTEVIELTVTDTGGLESAPVELKVLVNEVIPPDWPPVECGDTLFALDAGTDVVQVLLSGTFNGWADSPAGTELMEAPDGNGVWEVTVALDPGKYEYKFIVDEEWMEDPKNPDKVDDGNGGFNSVVEVPECEE